MSSQSQQGFTLRRTKQRGEGATCPVLTMRNLFRAALVLIATFAKAGLFSELADDPR